MTLQITADSINQEPLYLEISYRSADDTGC